MEVDFSSDQPVYILVKSHKSAFYSFLLVLLLGPIGLLYSSIKGGIIMLLISLGIIYFTISIALIVTWPVCLIWAAKASGKSMEHLRTIKTTKEADMEKGEL